MSFVLEVGVCLTYHFLAPRMARTDRGSCPSVQLFVQWPHSLKQCLINICQQGLSPAWRDKDQITTIFEIDCLLFCLTDGENFWHCILLNHSEISHTYHVYLCTSPDCTSSLSHHIMWTSEHAAGDRSLWEQHMEGLLSIPPVCPLNVVTRVQFSCSSLRMVTWPEWSPINPCRVSTSNLSRKH